VPVGGARRHAGTLVYADDNVIRIQPADAAPDGSLELRHDQIERSRTVLVWGSTGSHAKVPAPSRPAKARTKKAQIAADHAVLADPDSKDSES
jgi:hypothetical protein